MTNDVQYELEQKLESTTKQISAKQTKTKTLKRK